jgi:negative regulator of flagellin synthesis FlgM
MKIEKTSSPTPAPKVGETGSRAPAARTTGNKTNAAETGGTSVHLGTTTAQLHTIESSMANTPVVDPKKIAEIKQAITEGRFQVNSEVVADRLISTVKELITASQH